MSGNTFQLTTTQLNWLSTNYPTVAHYTEGGGDYFSPPSPNSPNAGYSFGPFQFDVKANPNVTGQTTVQDFLSSLTLDGQQVFSSSDIAALATNGGISQSNLTDLSNQLAQALQDPSNQTAYQNILSGQLNNLESQLQNAIDYAANNGDSTIANKILNDPSAQLRIMDYANQLGITPGGILDQFLSGQTVNMPATGNSLTINPNQSLDAQLQNFYQNTAAGANQTSSRVNNLNQGLESVLGGNDTNNQNGGVLGLQLSYELGNAQKQVIDPLVISTNGQAVTTTSLANGAFVDYQGTGFAEQNSGLSSNAGLLVDVTNPNGTLNNGFTIIGSSTANQNVNTQGQAVFTQLVALDTNHDGVINASDTDFSQIEIWVGSNGQPGSGHLETLAQAGATSISLNSTVVNTIDADGDRAAINGSGKVVVNDNTEQVCTESHSDQAVNYIELVQDFSLTINTQEDSLNSDNTNLADYNDAGYDINGYDSDGYDISGYDSDGYDSDGYDINGYDSDGYDINGYDSDGYNINGYDSDGYDSDGYDVNGYDSDGYDSNGDDNSGSNSDVSDN